MKEETRPGDAHLGLRLGSVAVERGRRRRRPTGEPPPLPRKLGSSGHVWLALLVVLTILGAAALRFDPVLELTNRIDGAILRAIAGIRTSSLTTVMRGIKSTGSGWGVAGAAWAMVVALMVLRRGRHLLVFMLSLAAIEFAAASIIRSGTRPRPFDVEILSGWGGSSFLSPPVMLLVVVLLGICYTLVPAGRARSIAKWTGGVVVALVAVSRLYLAVDHPSDVAIAIIFGGGIPLLAYRLFAPNDAFPVRYRRGKAAHLDVTGPRGEAIRRAVQDQLGLSVKEIRPVGLAGSGGSTPLRLTVAGDPQRYLFAKLYAKSHVQADRWYKILRTVLYGRLEDETPFQTVRRFVQYEDYTLRLLHDEGLPVPEPYGVVEITPEAEYLIVMEFFEGAVELGDAVVDDAIIDQGLALVASMWEAGLAHRDIKPANLMVRRGELLLIDVFFVQVRPSPWRQAVDLANMMLVLALRSDVERVYRHALEHFTPDDIAEAFAAARGLASPSQLRAALKRDGRDLVARFRALAPERRPVAIQRWSVRRVALTVGLLTGAAIAAFAGGGFLVPVQDLPVFTPPTCGGSQASILAAQAVPSATRVPCIASLPAGWSFGDAQVHTDEAVIWLNSDRAGYHAVGVRLTESCPDAAGVEVPSDEEGTRRFEEPESLRPRAVGSRYYLFPGGCVRYRYGFTPGAPSTLLLEIDQALALEPRATLVAYVDEHQGQVLCGAGARCPG
ncbi:MAG TPA: RIO1 family regulatory kinase/ATPase [Actinomycetota bacterium]|nr:RIO1 family regulatory kinase/ATPase [Actinomycetota bacterium]